MFTDEDLEFFARQRHQQELAYEALRRGRERAGAKGSYVAFHDGKIVARSTGEPFAQAVRQFGRAEVYLMYLPGASDVLVYSCAG